MENKKKAFILRNKMDQLKERSEEINLDSLISKELEEYREVKGSHKLKLISFRLTGQDVEFIRDLTHSIKVSWDPYITQAEVIHIAVKILKESIGEAIEERPAEVRAREDKERKPRKDKRSNDEVDLGFD
jgi:Arc/MetJ-type ribon-helix-helix transcriptional regulator